VTVEECKKLIARALETPALGVCIMALKAVRELELCPPGTLAMLEAFRQMEPVLPDDGFEGKFVESLYDGFCKDCGTPYAEGELVFWQGRGKGALCQGCRVADTSPAVKSMKRSAR